MENNFNFVQYYPDQEIYSDDDSKKGDYWKFLELSNDEIRNLGIYEPNLCKIILNISDENLKSKMKQRLINYIKELGTTNTSINGCISTGLFTEDEIKDILIEDHFDLDLKKFIEDDKKWDVSYRLKSYISTCFLVDDVVFQIDRISNIIDIVKNTKYSEKNIIRIFENIEKLNEYDVFNTLLDKYSSDIPDMYKNYVKLYTNKNFLRDRSVEIEKRNIKIDIDPKIKIGVEIETNHPYSLYINIGNQNDFWNSFFIDRDPTVPDGIEVCSKPFTDNVKDVSKFVAMCETLKDVGYYFDEEKENASGQINLGLDYLDSPKSIINFYEIFGNVEELLFYISNGNCQLTRQQIYRNSRFKPISEILGSRIIDEDISRDDVIKMFNIQAYSTSEDAIKGLQYKKNTVCLRGKDEDDYRLEIRIPNGGNDYEIWIDNIRLYGRMMQVSKKIADLMNKDYITRDEENLIKLKLELEQKNISLDEKLVILMDLLFDEVEYKKIYYERFNNTVKKIKESGTTKYDIPKYIKAEPIFDVVEFQEKYNSKIEEDANITYDPKENIYIENGRRQRL